MITSSTIAAVVMIAISLASAGYGVYTYESSKAQSESMFAESKAETQRASERMEQLSRESEARSVDAQMDAERRLAAESRYNERARWASIYGRNYRGNSKLRKD